MDYVDIKEVIARRKFNKYSQGGEDGLLQEIFERLGTENKWCFEAGAGDGIFFSNTRKLVEEGWDSIQVEWESEAYKKLCVNSPEKTICENVKVEPSGENTLDNILKRNGAPIEIDLLCLDIDGQDYHVFNSLMEYKPRVVVIEYDVSPENTDFIPTVGGEGQAGKSAIEKMLWGRQYRPVFSTLSNIIAVRAELEGNLLGFTADIPVGTPADMPVKLNLGSGDEEMVGYINYDRKNGKEAYPLDVADNSVDEIYASHILEHFGWKSAIDVLRDWASKLKGGGVMKIAVPDFRKISEMYLAGKKIPTTAFICGGQFDEDDYHKALFDKESLSALMDAVGLTDIKPWESQVKDAASMPISLNLQGTKGSPIIPDGELKKIAAVMSMPRLTFADNMHTAACVMMGLNIKLTRGTGVFWGQVLTNMLEDAMADDAEWIFTLDYDTWFEREHVVRLCQLMSENPDVDAIIPVQSKREGDEPLVGMRDENGGVLTSIHRDVFRGELTPVGTGHFGLTLFRASSLKKLKKPWIWAQPGPDGQWREGRQDADIYFWNQFFHQGFKAVQANRVVVGHMQLMCTFPDTVENGFKPIHMHVTDLQKNGPPAHCKPEVTLIKG